MNHDENIPLPEDFDNLEKYAPLLHAIRVKGDGFVVPENYFSESEELTLTRTGLPLQDGFTVPENYFDELAARILAAVAISEASKDKNAGLGIPENYFETLSDKIAPLVSVHDLKDEEPFRVPEDYFSGLNDELPAKIALDNLRQDEGFAVPEGYFEKFTEKIVSRVTADSLSTGSDSDVPEGYFDSLADRISARIEKEEGLSENQSKEKGRIIVFAEIVKRYARPAALAASAALLIAGAIWFLNREKDPQENLANSNVPAKKVQPVPAPFVPGDSVSNPQLPKQKTEQLAASSEKNNQQKSNPRINHQPVPVVKVKKQDVMEQIDLIDESLVAEYISEQGIGNTNDLPEDAIENSIIDMTDIDPALLMNDGLQKK